MDEFLTDPTPDGDFNKWWDHLEEKAPGTTAASNKSDEGSRHRGNDELGKGNSSDTRTKQTSKPRSCATKVTKATGARDSAHTGLGTLMSAIPATTAPTIPAHRFTAPSSQGISFKQTPTTISSISDGASECYAAIGWPDGDRSCTHCVV